MKINYSCKKAPITSATRIIKEIENKGLNGQRFTLLLNNKNFFKNDIITTNKFVNSGMIVTEEPLLVGPHCWAYTVVNIDPSIGQYALPGTLVFKISSGI